MNARVTQVARQKADVEDPLSLFMSTPDVTSVEVSPVVEETVSRRDAFSPSITPVKDSLEQLGRDAWSAANVVMDAISTSMNSNPTVRSVLSRPASSQNYEGVIPASPVSQRKEVLESYAADATEDDDDIREPPSMLSGEKVLISLKDAFVQSGPGRHVPGTLFMTNYRLMFSPSPPQAKKLAKTHPNFRSMVNVPISCIDKIEKEKMPRDAQHSGIAVLIHCKDARQVRITLHGLTMESHSRQKKERSIADIERTITVMEAYAFPNNVRYLFSFAHAASCRWGEEYPPVRQYDTVSEFIRQGILDLSNNPNSECQWRFSDANRDYTLCDSYPKLLIVPRYLTDKELFVVAGFRSGRRLPMLSWGDSSSGATLWRSSQPKGGVSGSCSQDERFLDYIAHSCTAKISPLGVKRRVANAELFIVDCRPRASAMANRAVGAGYELSANYPHTRLEFMGIGNIHVMRDSFKSLCAVMTNYNTSDTNFSKAVEDSQWLSHVRLVIRAAWESALSVTKEVPVLVHCSHGWDRTAQVCGIAQLFLDPYYRTIEGFHMLVEKEFISFGHPFHLRCAHGQDKSTRQDDQISPIFVQFLDCVWQLVMQFPHYFEFNARYLLTLADHVYSCRFGTFLLGSDADRVSACVMQFYCSINCYCYKMY